MRSSSPRGGPSTGAMVGVPDGRCQGSHRATRDRPIAVRPPEAACDASPGQVITPGDHARPASEASSEPASRSVRTDRIRVHRSTPAELHAGRSPSAELEPDPSTCAARSATSAAIAWSAWSGGTRRRQSSQGPWRTATWSRWPGHPWVPSRARSIRGCRVPAIQQPQIGSGGWTSVDADGGGASDMGVPPSIPAFAPIPGWAGCGGVGGLGPSATHDGRRHTALEPDGERT